MSDPSPVQNNAAETQCPKHLTPAQEKWFASVRDGLQAKTGKSLEAWVDIAKTCPETAPKKRLQWFKANHGLGQNYACQVLAAAFPSERAWDAPLAVRSGLWTDPQSLLTLETVLNRVADLPELVVGDRKSFTSLSKAVQFAALRPNKSGGAVMGLKLDPQVSTRLSAVRRRESWSERLAAQIELSGPADFDDEIEDLLRSAYQNG